MAGLHLEILPERQRRIWEYLGPVTDLGCVLYGGTALALQLGHSISEDYDFFSPRELREDMIFAALPWLQEAELLRVRREVNKFVYETPDNIKLTFLGGIPLGTRRNVFIQKTMASGSPIVKIFSLKN